MRILIEPLGDHSLNLGDVAMRQVAVRRLRALWPDSTIRMLTKDPDELRRVIPDVEPVDVHAQRAWVRPLAPERIRRRLGPAAAAHVAAAEREVRTRWPATVQRVVVGKRRALRQPSDGGEHFLDVVLDSDLVFVSGAGAINDHFGPRLSAAFELLLLAARRGTATAMMGQGIGPLDANGATFAVARRVLPGVGLIGLREDRTGPALLRELAVPHAKIAVTGDDAVEMAYELREDSAGGALGLNVRVAGYVQLSQADLTAIATQIDAFGKTRRPPLLPIPTSQHEGEVDLDVARSVAERLQARLIEAGPLETPEEAVRRVARCRVLLTGSYHAAVFALAQGIPAVCLAPNAYYLQKFEGLASLFGPGCYVVRRDFSGLAATLEEAWESAAALREPLRAAAATQIAGGKEAYARLESIVQVSDD